MFGNRNPRNTSYDFANGEMCVRFTEPGMVRTCSCCKASFERYQQVDHGTAHRDRRFGCASAKSITVVAPFLGYSRGDKSTTVVVLTARLIFDLFHAAGAGRIMTGRSARRSGAGFLRWSGRSSNRHAECCSNYVRSTA